MTKETIALHIIENLLKEDLLNVADYNLEDAKAVTEKIITAELNNYVIVQGQVVEDAGLFL